MKPVILLAAALALAAPAFAQGAQSSSSIDTDVADLKPGQTIVFTFFWSDGGNWENIDFSVVVGPPDMP